QTGRVTTLRPLAHRVRRRAAAARPRLGLSPALRRRRRALHRLAVRDRPLPAHARRRGGDRTGLAHLWPDRTLRAAWLDSDVRALGPAVSPQSPPAVADRAPGYGQSHGAPSAARHQYASECGGLRAAVR